jgi:hypothetical protein
MIRYLAIIPAIGAAVYTGHLILITAAKVAHMQLQLGGPW